MARRAASTVARLGDLRAAIIRSMVAKSAFTLRGLFPWGATRKIRPVVWSLKAQPPTPASYQSATNTEPCSSDRFRVARVSQAIAGHGTEAILPRGSRSVQTESLAREAP